MTHPALKLTQKVAAVSSRMKRRFFPWALAATACGALFLAGCSTTESRISGHPEIYQRLSPPDQELVQRGQIRPGMAQGAVFLAWGAPEQKTVANIHGRPAETWVYFSSTATGGYGYPYWGYGPYYGAGFYGGRGRFYRHHGRRYYGFGYDPFDPFLFGGTQIVSYPYKTISFQNGRVVAYQFLAPPRVY
jgi:outer membrane protein assembly factor BamE (lipoprotein component of BamABCDE complex)